MDWGIHEVWNSNYRDETYSEPRRRGYWLKDNVSHIKFRKIILFCLLPFNVRYIKQLIC